MSYGKPLVYLAGPITGLTYDGATTWREYAKRRLEEVGILSASPLRFKRDGLPSNSAIANRGYTTSPLTTDKGIITRDRFDCTRSDLVLVNLVGAEKVSIGTVMEIAWADSARRPVVVAMEATNIHQHSMTREAAGFICPTLEEALDVAMAILDVQNVECHA